MLYIVLALVLAALGLLVTALVMANSLWAWISIGLSVLAGLLLVVDWLRRRSRRPVEEAITSAEAAPPEAVQQEEPATGETTPGETELVPVSGELDSAANAPVVEPDIEDGAVGDDDSRHDEAAASPARVNEEACPGEEPTDPGDLLVVSQLDDEVVVVDEHPRYHLAQCSWLLGRVTIPIAVSEARQLGFTPCKRCRPDGELIERQGARRTSGAGH